MDRPTCATFVLLITQSLLAAAPTPARISHTIDENETFTLHANTHPAVAAHFASDQGSVSGSHRMPRLSLHFSLTPSQQADLDQLLAAQQNRRSPQFHKFLSPEQFADRFGLSTADLETVTHWLENHGFSNIQSARARTFISFSGSAAQAQSAFHTRIHKYSLNGETYVANTTDPQLPQALANIAQSIGGLNNFRAVPLIQRAHPHLGIGGCNPACVVVAPADWTAIYDVNPLYGAGFDGTGVTLAIVGQSDVALSDLRAFRSAANLPPKDPTVVIPTGDTDPGIQSSTGDEAESDLDLEWAGAIAKNANILFVTANATTGNGVGDALTYVIDQNLAPIVSISYGYCESAANASFFTSFNTLLAQANAQGMSVVAASGDHGAACNQSAPGALVTQGYSASFPASSPNATAIGGSDLSSDWSGNGTATSYLPETVWNQPNGLVSGGGASIFFAAPAWQIAPGIPNDGWRDFPDLAFTASNGTPNVVCFSGSCINGFLDANGDPAAIYGTSAAAPPFAGFLALLVQKTGAPLGNINPNLYSLAQISGNSFHDITTGNNYLNCAYGTPDCPNGGVIGYPALVGFDQASGWGSIDAYNLADQWSGDIQLTASPTKLTLAPGTSATSTITVAPQNHFGGPVTLTCSVSSSLIDVSCSVPPGVINTSGSAVVTITATKYARTLWLRRLPHFPPPSRGFVLTGLLLLCAVALFRKRPTYLWIALASCTLGVLFVSCGGGSSTGGTQPKVVAPLALSCSIPSVAQQNVAFNASCTASGGTAPYTYYIASNGTLPGGITLNGNTGVISGTPTQAQITSFTVIVYDSSTPQKQQSTVAIPSLTVNATGPLVLTCNFQGMAVGLLAYAGCGGTGATPPVTLSFSAGALPTGLTFNAGASDITGIPTKTGNFSFTLKGTDSSQPPQNATQAFTVTVGPPQPLVANFGSAIVQAHVPLSESISPSGGLAPYTFALTSGALPAGLTLTPAGILSGTPEVPGNNTFSITVTDSYSPPETVTAPATFTVTPPPPESGTVTITATSGGIVNTVTIAVSVPGN